MSHDTGKIASQILFQNSLAEVVRKLRTSKKSERDTIAECIQEIKSEITSPVQMVKVTAVVKLTYFTMLGYSADYAAFNVIEVMADANFQNKRAGYVAAALTFNEHTDVLPLCTALLKRDLSSTNMYEVGLALYCLSTVASPDLAKDLIADVVGLLSHTRSYVRKKAVLCIYKLFLQYPEALRPTYPKLKEKIEDDCDRSDNDPAVRGAVVSILCEMARRNPQNFMSLAVPFFSLLSSVHNNWTLIKVIKVFGYFAPLEPRLGKKLAEPIANLIATTGAKSVQYECILAVANGMSRVSSVTKLAVEKMKFFVEDRDANLKYLGLDAMTRVMHEAPKSLADQRETILQCLVDADVTIRRKALDLLRGTATPKNMVASINSMFDACVRTPPDEDWSNLVIRTIIETAQTDDYALVHDFEWYTGVLIDLALIDLSHFHHGAMIERELVTILTRVKAIRPYTVEALAMLLSNSVLLGCDVSRSTQWMVLKAAAFAAGEFPQRLPNMLVTMQCLLSDKIATMPVDLQVLCVAAAGKVYQYAVHPCPRHLPKQRAEGEDGEEEEEEEDEIVHEAASKEALLELLLPSAPPTDAAAASNDGFVSGGPDLRGLRQFYHSVFPDVQERAQIVHHFITQCGEEASVFFERELPAVAIGAQDAVIPPDGLDLNEPFCGDIPGLMACSDADTESEEEPDEDAPEGVVAERRDRRRREEVSMFYIKEEAGDDLPPVTKLEGGAKAGSPAPGNLRNAAGRRAGKKTHAISRDMAKPATYTAADKAKAAKSAVAEEDEATRRLRGIDVSKALSPDERLPEATTYAAMLDAKSRAAAEEARRAELALRVPPVVAFEDKAARVVFQITECKVKKSGYFLHGLCSVTNLTPSTSLYEVRLSKEVRLGAVEGEPAPPEGPVGILSAAGADDAEEEEAPKKAGKKDKEKKDEGSSEAAAAFLSVLERLKPGATASKDFVLQMEALPDTFALPLQFGLTFTHEKKPVDAPLLLPLVFKYFAATDAPVPSTAEFNETILGKHLADAACVSAVIPLAARERLLLLALPSINAQLRTHAIEVFKDAVTLYTQMASRKSHADRAHVAILLRSAPVPEDPDTPALHVTVKGTSLGMLDAVIQEIGAVVLA